VREWWTGGRRSDLLHAVVIQIGDLAEWAAAVGTAGSVAYLAVTRRRDQRDDRIRQRDDRIRQARLIRAVRWEESGESDWVTPGVDVSNLSELQVVDLELEYPRRHYSPYSLSILQSRDLLKPGETWKTEWEAFEDTDDAPRPHHTLTFTDAQGRRWRKVVGTPGDPQPA
jgi:hypothetical protein